MRNIFINTMIENAEKNDKVVLLMAEVGYGVVEPYQHLFPNRFYNTGISEQSLVLTAAGLAMKGFSPVAYSMSSFLPTRGYEMIKDSICYQNLPVTLVGIGSGISYGKLGTTHHASEESALMRTLPNMTVIFPTDGDDCRDSIDWAINHNGPVYIGLEKMKVDIYKDKSIFDLRWKKCMDGEDATVFACGTMKTVAEQAGIELKKMGINISVYGISSVKPIDEDAIMDSCKSGNIIVLDEHSAYCGLASDISKVLFINNKQNQIKSFTEIAIPDVYPNEVWDEYELRRMYGMAVDNLINIINEKIGANKI